MSEFFPTHAEMMAQSFGIVLGAASCSDQISNERLDTAAQKIKTVLSVAAGNVRDADAAVDRFSAAVVAGRRAVKQGAIEEWAAETALRKMEDDLDEVRVELL